MKIKILFAFLALCLGCNFTMAQTIVADATVKGSVVKENVSTVKIQVDKNEKWRKRWKAIKGRPAQDAILLGMQSYHTNNHDYNQTNKLVGLQYKGFAYGHFENSFYENSYYIAAVRNVWQKQFSHDISMGVQYKAGLLHGYGDRYPNVGGITPVVLPALEFNYKAWGVDVLVIPSNYPIFAGNLRLNLDYIAKHIQQYKQNNKLNNKTVKNNV